MSSGISDFLFQGSAPPNVNTTGQTTSTVPEYLQQYNQGILAKANALSALPYPVYGGQRIADTNDYQQAGWNQGVQAANSYQPMFAQAGQSYGQAGQGNASAAAAPWLQQAGSMDATGAAQPYMQAAMQSMPGQVSAYMSPYMSTVLDGIAQQGTQNLQQNLLPAVGDDFIRAGQLGSSRQMTAVGNALQSTQQAVSNAQSAALQNGYSTAVGAFQNDANRALQAGQTMGSLTNQQQSNMGALGQMAGNFNSIDSQNALNVGNAQLNLGKATQAAGLTGAAATSAVGDQIAGKQQQNLDLAYQDFQNQANYDRNNTDWMATLTRGQPSMGGSVYTSSNAPLPGSQYQPSGLAQIAGGLSLMNALGKAKGGAVTKAEARAKGVPVGGALSGVARPPKAAPAPHGGALATLSRRPPPVRIPRGANPRLISAPAQQGYA